MYHYIIYNRNHSNGNAYLGFRCEEWTNNEEAFKFPSLVQANEELKNHKDCHVLAVKESLTPDYIGLSWCWPKQV